MPAFRARDLISNSSPTPQKQWFPIGFGKIWKFGPFPLVAAPPCRAAAFKWCLRAFVFAPLRQESARYESYRTARTPHRAGGSFPHLHRPGRCITGLVTAIPPIVSELTEYASSGHVGSELSKASFGSHPSDRVVCIKLLSWWRRGTLLRSSWPYIELQRAHPWCERLITLVAAHPSFGKVIVVDGDTCKFAPHLSRDDWKVINEFVREHYRPVIMKRKTA